MEQSENESVFEEREYEGFLEKIVGIFTTGRIPSSPQEGREWQAGSLSVYGILVNETKNNLYLQDVEFATHWGGNYPMANRKSANAVIPKSKIVLLYEIPEKE